MKKFLLLVSSLVSINVAQAMDATWECAVPANFSSVTHLSYGGRASGMKNVLTVNTDKEYYTLTISIKPNGENYYVTDVSLIRHNRDNHTPMFNTHDGRIVFGYYLPPVNMGAEGTHIDFRHFMAVSLQEADSAPPDFPPRLYDIFYRDSTGNFFTWHFIRNQHISEMFGKDNAPLNPDNTKPKIDFSTSSTLELFSLTANTPNSTSNTPNLLGADLRHLDFTEPSSGVNVQELKCVPANSSLENLSAYGILVSPRNFKEMASHSSKTSKNEYVFDLYKLVPKK